MSSDTLKNKETPKLRHIAILVPDPEASAVFFESAFGMKRVGLARRGVYVSDGIMNVALLRVNPEKGEKVGVFHFGVWVEDFDAADEQVKAAEAYGIGSKQYLEAN